jgi:hypothetical protein
MFRPLTIRSSFAAAPLSSRVHGTGARWKGAALRSSLAFRLAVLSRHAFVIPLREGSCAWDANAIEIKAPEHPTHVVFSGKDRRTLLC